MKKPQGLFLSLLVFLGLFLALSHARQNVPQTPSGQKIKNLMTAIQRATSLEEVDEAYTKAALTQSEADSLEALIKASPHLQSKLRALAEKEEATAKDEVNAKDEELERRIEKAKEEFVQSITAAAASTVAAVKADAAKLERTSRADAPAISKISHARVGKELFISGNGFGEKRGTVILVTQGKSFNTHWVSWTQCLISVLVPDYITGVKGDKKATVSLTTAEGKTATGNTEFVPVYSVATRAAEVFCKGGYYLGSGSCDKIFWNSKLKNDWELTDNHLKRLKYSGGHAEIKEASPLHVPNGLARVKVHSGANYFAMALYTLYQSARGPRGLSPW